MYIKESAPNLLYGNSRLEHSIFQIQIISYLVLLMNFNYVVITGDSIKNPARRC